MDPSLDPALKVAEFLLRDQGGEIKPQKALHMGLRVEVADLLRQPQDPVLSADPHLHPAAVRACDQQRVRATGHHRWRGHGGIAHGALVAHDMGLPFIYVRSDAKTHGMQNQVEGDLTVGRSVVLVEDLVSTGGSSLRAAQALREAGCEVKGMVAIFTYGFDTARKAFDEARGPAYLDQLQHPARGALRSDYITEKDLLPLGEWRKDPANWGGAVKA